MPRGQAVGTTRVGCVAGLHGFTGVRGQTCVQTRACAIMGGHHTFTGRTPIGLWVTDQGVCLALFQRGTRSLRHGRAHTARTLPQEAFRSTLRTEDGARMCACACVCVCQRERERSVCVERKHAPCLPFTAVDSTPQGRGPAAMSSTKRFQHVQRQATCIAPSCRCLRPYLCDIVGPTIHPVLCLAVAEACSPSPPPPTHPPTPHHARQRLRVSPHDYNVLIRARIAWVGSRCTRARARARNSAAGHTLGAESEWNVVQHQDGVFDAGRVHPGVQPRPQQVPLRRQPCRTPEDHVAVRWMLAWRACGG